MRKIILLLNITVLTVLYSSVCHSQIGVGGPVANSSAVLELKGADKGFLMPRMTSAQRIAIGSPAEGLQVYDTTTNSVWCYNGAIWINIVTADATTLSKGLIQLSGDLSGTATSAVIADNAINSEKIQDGTVSNIDLAGGTGGIYKGNGSLSNSTTITGGNYGLSIVSSVNNSFSVGGTTLSVDANNKAVGIGTSGPSTKAALELNSDTKGLLLPRMTTSERNLITSPSNGLIIFNTSSGCIEVYNGSLWFNTCTSSDPSVTANAIGTVKYGLQASDHNGWILLNGRNLSALTSAQSSNATSIGISTSLPDARDRLPIGAGSSFASKSIGGSFMISKANFPTNSITDSSSYTPKGTVVSSYPSGKTVTTDNNSHNHNMVGNGGWDGLTTVGFSDRTNTNSYPLFTSNADHNHTVELRAITNTFTGRLDTMSSSLQLNSVTQIGFAPPYLALNAFIFLGVD